jgi:hypothetical protein
MQLAKHTNAWAPDKKKAQERPFTGSLASASAAPDHISANNQLFTLAGCPAKYGGWWAILDSNQ